MDSQEEKCDCLLCTIKLEFDEPTLMALEQFKDQFLAIIKQLRRAQILDVKAKSATLRTWATITLIELQRFVQDDDDEFRGILEKMINSAHPRMQVEFRRAN